MGGARRERGSPTSHGRGNGLMLRSGVKNTWAFPRSRPNRLNCYEALQPRGCSQIGAFSSLSPRKGEREERCLATVVPKSIRVPPGRERRGVETGNGGGREMPRWAAHTGLLSTKKRAHARTLPERSPTTGRDQGAACISNALLRASLPLGGGRWCRYLGGQP